MKTSSFLLSIILTVLAILTGQSGLAKDQNAELKAAGEAIGLTSTKEEDECNAFREDIENKYTLPAVALSLKGKHDKAIELYKAALTKVRESTLTSQWARDASIFDKHALHEYIANEYRALGRYDLSGQTMLENFHEQRELGYINAGLLTTAGEDFTKAEKPKEAEEAFGAALSAAAEASRRKSEMVPAEKERNTSPDAGRSADYTKTKAALYKVHQNLRQLLIAQKEMHRLQGDKAKVAEIEAQLADKHCPICGSDENIEPIAYGRILGAPKGYHLGGCEVGPDSPKWWCTMDEIEF